MLFSSNLFSEGGKSAVREVQVATKQGLWKTFAQVHVVFLHLTYSIEYRTPTLLIALDWCERRCDMSQIMQEDILWQASWGASILAALPVIWNGRKAGVPLSHAEAISGAAAVGSVFAELFMIKSLLVFNPKVMAGETLYSVRAVSTFHCQSDIQYEVGKEQLTQRRS